ncbi:MAG: response regulator [Thermomicrobia bacterium]|nr:response regulator [Thermomicrobia bacterium]MCA1723466.1 response regulator [Thermomicrobia bacterium]
MTAPTIALLDNDPAFLSLMHDVLTDEGYCTLRWCAGEQADAHALLRRAQPQLIILDLRLKRRDDGWEFLKRLWGDFETTHIPAIIVSGQPDDLPVKAGALRAMHCQMVRKPFCRNDLHDLHDLYDLMTAIERVLGRSPVKCARGEAAYTAAAGGMRVVDLADDDDALQQRA